MPRPTARRAQRQTETSRMTSLPDSLAHPSRLRRALALALVFLALLAGSALLDRPQRAAAATHGAGIANITPDGGYLGNFIAQDGSRGYCIDSLRDWPAGATTGPEVAGSLTTSWGAAIDAVTLQKLNFGLMRYGDTADPVQAAAVAAFVNAYTSERAHQVGAGHAAGSHYINGNADVAAVYDAIWADVEANAIPNPTAALSIEMSSDTAGAVRVTSTPAGVAGTLVLEGAVVAETGAQHAEVTDGSVIPIQGTPADDTGEYSVAASASFALETPASAAVLLYTTGDQQRLIRGSTPGEAEFAASASTAAIPLQFAPVVQTTVQSVTVAPGEPFVDVVTAAADEGSRPWRQRLDGSYLPVTAHGVLYGPFADTPARSSLPPADAPVAGEHTLVLSGPGEYRTEPTTMAVDPGYYTWVWTIDAALQDATTAASLPAGYRVASDFGIVEETHRVPAPVRPAPELARTSATSDGTALVALVLLVIGSGLGIVSRRVR